MTRLAVLRVKDARTLVVKEPDSPVVLLLRVDDGLSPAQLRCLCVATPFAPVMADGEIGAWSPGAQAFEGAIASVEMAPRGGVSVTSSARRDRVSLVKRKRGGGGVVELH